MKYLIITIMILANNAAAKTVKDNNCKTPQSGTGIAMMDEMYKSMGIDSNTIVREKTRTELLSNNAVSDVLATQYAQEEYRNAAHNWSSVERYKESYTEYNPRNLIIKFSYENKDKKQNIFLISAFANDYECDIRFNGYIIVKREF